MAEFVDPTEREIVYQVPGTEAVKVHRDLTYETDANHRQLDLYCSPDQGRKPLPVVLFIHGGVPPGVLPKDWGVFTSWGRLIAASGLAAVTFNHSLSFPYSEATLESAAKDVDQVIAWVREHAPRFNLDSGRLALVAFSAAGPLLSRPLREPQECLRCVAGFYPYLGNPLASASGERFFPLTALASPSPKMAPIFLARAGRDMPILNAAMDEFVKQALSINANIELHNHPGGEHGFDILNDDSTSRETIRRAVDFVTLHLTGRR